MQGSRCTSAEVDTQVPISFSPLLTGRSGFAKSERGQGNTDAQTLTWQSRPWYLE